MLCLLGCVATIALAQAEAPSLALFNAAEPGMTMSAAGLGTGGPGCYNESSDQLASRNSSLSWLQLGGRRFDGAISYACDRGIGAAVAASGVARADVFITSKVGPGGVPFALGFNETLAQAARILADIRSPYVDLLLVHEPFSYWPDPAAAARAPSSDPACVVGNAAYSEVACRLSTWRALVKLWRSGAARAIGVSNYNSSHIEEIEAAGLPLPAVNQVEFSPLHQGGGDSGGCNCGRSASRSTAQCGHSAAQDAETCAVLRAFLGRKRIAFNSYSPFGGGGADTAALLSDARLVAIGAAHNRSTAQVILNWQWAKSIVVNPQATNVVYQQENLDFADFELSAAEVAVLDNWAPQ